MAKSGQARVLLSAQQRHLFDVIAQHRHPEKNAAIMQISFKLGLRAQEIALLQIKEIARLNAAGTDFKLLEVMALPAAYTKGADALRRSKSTYTRRSISFTVARFDQVVREIEALAKAGAEVDPATFYPPVRKHRGKSRDLPMVDADLKAALIAHLRVRLEKAGSLRPSDPLFVSQKGGPYSPNTIQEHMAHMLRDWADVEKASSHSGRRSVITNVIHKQGKSVKVAQKIAGHVNPSTTLIYEEPPEEAVADALKDL
ncbi:MAG: site-specific integrase [Gammaproteobacteria bacterium]